MSAADWEDSSGEVRHAVSCLGCGYSLEQLKRDGVCPECGRPIEDSIRGARLDYADPAYVRTLRRGAGRVVWGIGSLLLLPVVSVVLAMAGATVLFALETSWAPDVFVWVSAAFWIVVAVAMLGAAVVFVHGWFVLTAADPDTRRSGPDGSVLGDPTRDPRSRKVARWTGICFPLALPIGWLAAWAAERVLPGSVFIPLAGLFFPGIVATVHAWAAMSYVRVLAGRMPTPRLGSSARDCRWVIAASNTLGIVLCGIGPVIGAAIYWSVVLGLLRHLRTAEVLAARRAERGAPVPVAPPKEGEW